MKVGGNSLLKSRHSGSLYALLSSVYNECEWLPWRFHIAPKNFIFQKTDRIKFMKWAGERLNIKEPNDWNQVTENVKNYSAMH